MLRKFGLLFRKFEEEKKIFSK